jgi:hypothetical protein
MVREVNTNVNCALAGSRICFHAEWDVDTPGVCDSNMTSSPENLRTYQKNIPTSLFLNSGRSRVIDFDCYNSIFSGNTTPLPTIHLRPRSTLFRISLSVRKASRASLLLTLLLCCCRCFLLAIGHCSTTTI